MEKGIMDKKLIIPGVILCADKKKSVLRNHCIEIAGDKIYDIRPFNKNETDKFPGEIISAEKMVLIPGFIQTHIHLCQTLFRGMADDLELLDWLQLKIFPYENAHDKNSLKASVRLGLNELISGGTTTILDMGTLRHQEVVFDELVSSGVRAFAGKCMMDENDLFPSFKADTKDELKNTYELAKSFHNSSKGKIKYGFAPRFALSCSTELLKETKEMMKDFDGSIFHTHSSENKSEINEVRKRYGRENIDYFNSINVLSDHTVLAHGIHTNDNEVNLLKKTNTRISHCPSSNLKLGSGIANIPEYLKEGISVSLGADGAPCNNSLSAFMEMRLAALIQKPVHGATSMDAETVFRLATIEGAKALHIDKEVGSVEIDKKADLVLLDLNSPDYSLVEDNESIYSNIIYTATKDSVDSVMVDGDWKVKNKKSLIFDNKELVSNGKSELNKLLERTS
jgi:cytosine/adenosine deaminase-related metal-dependent hydrolase